MGLKKYIAAAAVAALSAGMLIGAPAVANQGGYGEGCTPGFWKNHLDWKSYDDNPKDTADDFGPDTNVQAALRVSVPDGYGDLGSKTALQSLQGKGGPGLNGAGQILFRAAVASYLNADAALDFPLRRYAKGVDDQPSMQSEIQRVLNSKDRAQILAYAYYLDGVNNDGFCPLS